MIDHVGFTVRDFDRSRVFFENALAPLGITLMAHRPELKAAGFGPGTGRAKFWIGQAEATHGVDEIHVCFSAKTRAEVSAFYEAAIQAGGRDNGMPGLRPEYHAHYFGAFVLDPDGDNIEACCHREE
jgi:catechol 2,3-dioxygenase-like lactoylglutathione lyase family enzyme